MQKEGRYFFWFSFDNIKGLGAKAFLGTVFRGYCAGSKEQHPSPSVKRGYEHFRSDTELSLVVQGLKHLLTFSEFCILRQCKG